jgi:hypothetical protein
MRMKSPRMRLDAKPASPQRLSCASAAHDTQSGCNRAAQLAVPAARGAAHAQEPLARAVRASFTPIRVARPARGMGLAALVHRSSSRQAGWRVNEETAE